MLLSRLKIWLDTCISEHDLLVVIQLAGHFSRPGAWPFPEAMRPTRRITALKKFYDLSEAIYPIGYGLFLCGVFACRFKMFQKRLQVSALYSEILFHIALLFCRLESGRKFQGSLRVLQRGMLTSFGKTGCRNFQGAPVSSPNFSVDFDRFLILSFQNFDHRVNSTSVGAGT